MTKKPKKPKSKLNLVKIVMLGLNIFLIKLFNKQFCKDWCVFILTEYFLWFILSEYFLWFIILILSVSLFIIGYKIFLEDTGKNNCYKYK